MMNHVPVQSSMFESIGHDPATGTQEVKFKSTGAIYRREGVSATDHAAFVEAESLGQHYNRHMRSAPWTKVDADQSER